MVHPFAPGAVGGVVGAPPCAVPEIETYYAFDRLLGHGSQGDVWLMHEKGSFGPRSHFAVKIMKDCPDARREVQAYLQLRQYGHEHPGVMAIRFAFFNRWPPPSNRSVA